MTQVRKGTRRKNGEGSWGFKTIKGVKYRYFRKTYNDVDKYFYGKTEKEVKEKIRKFENENITTISKDIAKQTFANYISNWLKTVKQAEVKGKTYDSYEDIINAQIINYCDYDIGGKQIGALTEDMFRLYYNSLAKHYARSTIKRNYTLIRQCIRYAEKKGHVIKGVLDDVTIPSEDYVEVKKKEIQFLKKEDMEKIYTESKRINSLRYSLNGEEGSNVYGVNALAIIFLMYTGLRFGELIALRWYDINLKDKHIRIKNSISIVKNRNKKNDNDKKYIAKISSVKSDDSERIVPLSSRAIEVLNTLIIQHPNRKPEEFVFVNQNGNILNKNNVTRTLKAMLKRADCEIKECGLHVLRHTFASYLILKGVDIKVVSMILGHSNITITYNIYVHIIKEQKVNAVNIFDTIDKDIE